MKVLPFGGTFLIKAFGNQYHPDSAFSMPGTKGDIIIRYIRNQEENHRTRSFREEYLKMLNDFEDNYEDRYLLEFFD